MSETQVKELLSIGNKADLDKKMKEKPEELKKVLEGVQEHMNTINDDDTITPAERNKARELLVKLRQLDLDEKQSIETVATTTKANLADLIYDVELFSAYEAENVTDGTANLDTDGKKGVLAKFDAAAKELGISRSKAMIMAQRGWDISKDNTAALGGRYDLAIGPKVIGASEDPKKYIDIYKTWLTDSNSTESGDSQDERNDSETNPEEGEGEQTVDEKKAESLAKIDTLIASHADKLDDGVADMIRTQLIDEATGTIEGTKLNQLNGLQKILELGPEAWQGYKMNTGNLIQLLDSYSANDGDNMIHNINLTNANIVWKDGGFIVQGVQYTTIKNFFLLIQRKQDTIPDHADLTTNTQEGVDKKKPKDKYDSVNKELQSIKTDFPWSKFDFSVGQDGDSAIIKRGDSSETITRDGNYFLINYGNGEKSAEFTLKQAAVIANLLNFTRDFLNDGNKKVENDSEPFVRYGTGIDFAVDDAFDTGFIGDGSKWQTYYEKQGLSRDQIMGILNTWYHNSYEKKSS